ncbi:MAG: S41 family peptidase [Candidatus Gracilibacteria bacterium]|nr:S41 family peptidase [Candidatus Gracilibacteria bacterium]
MVVSHKKYFVFLICFLFFLLGIITSHLFSLPVFQQKLPSFITSNFGIQKSINSNTGILKEQSSINLDLFYEAYKQASENYYGFDTLSEKDLVSGMIKGFIDSFGDKHSEYFNLDETKKFNEVLSGDFEGIGAVIEKNDFGVIIDRIIAGSPAKEAGLLAGDIITKANNEELKNLDLNEAVSKIRGKAGTIVTLEIIRAGQKEIMTKIVTRKKIDIPSVDGKVIEGTTIGYIALSIFGEKTSDDFYKNLKILENQKITGLIIDLRDNGGGYLETAVSILSNFVEEDKVLVTTKEKNPFLNRSYFSYGNGGRSLPIVVLINENSASASEITAGALKDYNLAIIVGQKSYGKGSVQQPFILSDGSEMKVTVAKWYTPKDYGIDKVGIHPDIDVKFEKEDYEKKYDRQLEEAKKILLNFIKTGDKQKTVDIYKKEQEALIKKILETNTGAVKK